MQENKLYVGNLPYSTTNEQLAELFSAYGEVVEAVIITERGSNRSKGYGFVTMVDAETAQKAVAGLHETEFEGRKIIVNVARPKREEE